MRSRRPVMYGEKPKTEAHNDALPERMHTLWEQICTTKLDIGDVFITLFIGAVSVTAFVVAYLGHTSLVAIGLCFLLALISPTILMVLLRWNWALWKHLGLFGLIFASSLYVGHFFFQDTDAYPQTEAKQNQEAPPTVEQQKAADLEAQKAIEEEKQRKAAETKALLDEAKLIPKYKVMHTLPNYRADGGLNLYVLIPPADLANDSFKLGIQGLVRKLVHQYGAKTSMEFHDNRRSLNASFREYASENPSIPTPAEEALMAVHNIASFDGDLAGNVYPNTLTFFPATDTSNPKVGKYVDTIQFNP